MAWTAVVGGVMSVGAEAVARDAQQARTSRSSDHCVRGLWWRCDTVGFEEGEKDVDNARRRVMVTSGLDEAILWRLQEVSTIVGCTLLFSNE